MATIELSSSIRTKTGKGVARQLRREGLIPGIVYGNEESLSVSINQKDFSRLLKKAGTNSIVNLKIKNKNDRMVIIKELQKEVINKNILHVDLLEISMNKKLRIRVPIEETGTPVGSKKGGILTHLLREVEVECLPANIPQKLPIDISNLDVGDTLHVRDILTTDNVTILDNADETICVINLPEAEKSKEMEEEAAEIAAATETAEAASDEEKKSSEDKGKKDKKE